MVRKRQLAQRGRTGFGKQIPGAGAETGVGGGGEWGEVGRWGRGAGSWLAQSRHHRTSPRVPALFFPICLVRPGPDSGRTAARPGRASKEATATGTERERQSLLEALLALEVLQNFRSNVGSRWVTHLIQNQRRTQGQN